ncbi:hypothetical protein M501DRAFT_995025 [Patellaria atrata CBS 101060]|uniref:Erythromycin esterase n=1 Tax=Patellaria atrata CBS 101060 TaxID=1346257 RepID=A0A9P4S8D0_9PEZI|nr:hypothetical protein M501DRAFT_995025 [Patellaria atrata CBS 101060]
MVTTRRSSRLRSTPQLPGSFPDSETSAFMRIFSPPTTLPALTEDADRTTSTIPPQPPPTATPSAIKYRTLASVVNRTPTDRTPIQPAQSEIHPQQNHATTSKPLDEARWLGFMDKVKGARTEPVKRHSSLAAAQSTPTKATNDKWTPFSPTTEFTFSLPKEKSSDLNLSPEAQKIMADKRDEIVKIREQLRAARNEAKVQEISTARRIAQPKGKVGRFSDIHMTEFKKMDSITNHPSAFRADPNRFPPATKSLKRTQSKAEMDKIDGSVTPKQPPKSPGRTDERTVAQSKRAKRFHEDDISTVRPISLKTQKATATPNTPGTAPKRTSFMRKISGLMSPTKASLARSQSVKTMKTTTHIPSLLPKSPSLKSIPTVPQTPKPASKADEDEVSKLSFSKLKMPTVKGILRTPQRLYSNDPAQIAAGTHSPPPSRIMHFPSIPATAPVKKHVDFTASTKGSENKDEGIVATPKKPVVENKTENVTYPTLSNVVSPGNPGSVSRRMTLGGAGDFTFRSDRPINFGPSTTGPTIRRVRNSDAGDALLSTNESPVKKRKASGEISKSQGEDKENEDEEQGRRKKARITGPEIVKTTIKTATSKLPRRKEKRPGSLSQARLNLLATPKRRK